jgi:hypothetical protein
VWTEIVRERHGFGEIGVEPQGFGDGAGDLRRFHRVGQAGPIVVALVVHEDLRLVLEPAEGGAVDDAVAVALEGHAERVLVLGMHAAAGGRAVDGVGREELLLERRELRPRQHGGRVPCRMRCDQQASAGERHFPDGLRLRRQVENAAASIRSSDACPGVWHADWFS